MSHLFASDDQNTGDSASASVPSSEYSGWSPLGLTGLIPLLSKGLSGVFSSTTVQRHLFIWHSGFFMVQVSQPYMTTGKTIALTIQTSVGRVMSLLFNTLPRFVIAFLPKSNCLLISWLQSPSAVILEPKKRKSITTYTFSPSICHVVMGLDAMILVFYLVLSWLFHSPLSPSSRGSLVPLCFLPLEWCHPLIWGCWCFSCLSWFWLVTHPAWQLSWYAQRLG